ncbi:hypothetical protein MYX75_10175, partial [Acidobacteria bacterium AH-259-A15]|nr:hypothetical protein [Acidobacteria bacterium AH-259-A15]
SGAVEKLPDLAVARQPVWTLRRTLLLVSGMVLVAAVAGVMGWILKSAPELPLHKFELAVDSLEAGIETPLAVSPDGKKVVYVSAGRLWIRELDQLEPRQLSRSEEAHLPFWSPDSAFVGYVAAGKLWRVPVSGGESTTISDLQGALVGGAGATWGPNGQIVFSRGSTGLLEVSARGGDPQPLLELDPKSEGDFHQPHFLPDGRGVLFVVHRKQQAPDTLALLAGQTRKVLLQLEGQALWSPVYSPTGHILYRREPTNAGIWALPFSLSKLEVTGEPFLMVPEAMYPSVSSDRTLIYVRRASTALTQMVWVNRSGQVESAIGQPQRQWPFPALSPDGERVAVGADENDNWDIWIHDVARGTKTRLTFSDGMDTEPAWSPAGDQIVFRSGDNPSEYNISVKAADGTGQPQTLVKGITPAFSPDGKFLLYSARSEETGWDLWYLPWDGDKKPVVFLQTDGWQYWPRVSPDGRYLAYTSDESGRNEVYLKLFPSAEGKWQVSVNGGHWPRWSSSGDRLFYAEGDYLREVEVTTRPSLTLGTPRKLFTRQASGGTSPFGWPDGFDVAANGRFVLVQSAESDKGSKNPGITVVQNWFTEFKNDQ